MAQDIVGLALPAIQQNGGYFADRDALDTAFGDLILAVMCPVGGRFMRRRFGSTVQELLFVPASEALKSALRSSIVSVAKQYVPNVVIKDVTIKIDAQEVSMNIKFALATDTTNVRQRLLTVSRKQAIQFLSARSH